MNAPQPSPPPTLDVTLLRALIAPYCRPVQVQRVPVQRRVVVSVGGGGYRG